MELDIERDATAAIRILLNLNDECPDELHRRQMRALIMDTIHSLRRKVEEECRYGLRETNQK